MKLLFINLSIIFNFLTLNTVNASVQIPVKDIWTTNLYAINQDKIIDNVFFENMVIDDYRTVYSNSIWWTGSQASITIDLGSPFVIQDVLLEVDANDYYHIDYSINEIDWSTLFIITPEDGNVFWGLDTMSSDRLHDEYVANIDFSAIEARYIQISASGGDNVYHISELQVFSNTTTLESALNKTQEIASPVPAPTTLMLFGTGLMMLMGLQYRRKRHQSRTSNSKKAYLSSINLKIAC